MKIIMKLFLVLSFLTISAMTFAEGTRTFVFVKILDSVEPLERASKYEDPLGSALLDAKLGEVTGGGSLISKEKKILWVGVDVELNDLAKGLPFLKKQLIKLGAPKGSTLEYQINKIKTEALVYD